MDNYQVGAHTKWECKYHVVFIPKCRRKVLYGELRRHLGTVFRTLAQQRESAVEWARGYFVSTVGRDEAVIRAYIQHQESEDKRMDQLNLL